MYSAEAEARNPQVASARKLDERADSVNNKAADYCGIGPPTGLVGCRNSYGSPKI